MASRNLNLLKARWTRIPVSTNKHVAFALVLGLWHIGLFHRHLPIWKMLVFSCSYLCCHFLNCWCRSGLWTIRAWCRQRKENGRKLVCLCWYTTSVYAVRAIKRVPAGSCHFLCLTDPSQSVVSVPCVRKWEHIKTTCAIIAWALALWLWSRHYSTRETEGFSGPPCPVGM